MPNLTLAELGAEIEANARRALSEDIGSGDITAQLIPAERLASARVITREEAVICGTAWVDAVFRQLDPRVAVHWQVQDGDKVSADQTLLLTDRAGNGKEIRVDRKELIRLVTAAQAKNPDQPVLIAGDRNVKYEAVLRVMDELQRQQVERIGLLVQPNGK